MTIQNKQWISEKLNIKNEQELNIQSSVILVILSSYPKWIFQHFCLCVFIGGMINIEHPMQPGRLQGESPAHWSRPHLQVELCASNGPPIFGHLEHCTNDKTIHFVLGRFE
jgi:hypothetical protein